MDCNEVDERLPWLLNGSLAEPEAAALRAHLAGCPGCQASLAEARRAAAVFGAHLPTAVVVDLAWDRPPQGLDSALVREHLDACADCREELEPARESRALESAAAAADVTPLRAAIRPAPSRWTGVRVVLPSALAAGLLIGFALGARRPTPVAPPDDGRVAALESETSRLRGLVAALESEVRAVRPRINLPLFELLPSLVRRGEGPEATAITIPPGATEVALLLGTEHPPGTGASIVITDAAGREIWKADGLVSGPPGGFVITVPAAMLPTGAATVRLVPKAGAPADYRIAVRRS
jgi:hypothetical protein